MESVPSNIGGWVWWTFSVFILSIGVNLAAAYLKPVADRWLEKYSSNRRFKNELAKKSFETQLERMLSDDTEAVFVMIYLNRMIALIGTFLTVGILLSVGTIFVCSGCRDLASPSIELIAMTLAILPFLGLILLAFNEASYSARLYNAYRERKRQQS